tara:strand:+ start:15 stop:308 length:294 start_codon:yes stop_codon:yes gene_type:complete
MTDANDYKPAQVTMNNDEDPFIGSLNELIMELQDLVAEHPEAGDEDVRVVEDWDACDACEAVKLTNHWVGVKANIFYHPSGSSGYERSGCVIIKGGE